MKDKCGFDVYKDLVNDIEKLYYPYFPQMSLKERQIIESRREPLAEMVNEFVATKLSL